MVLELYHWSILDWIVSSICLLMVVKLTKFLSDLLNFLVVVVLLNLTILVVRITTHSHAGIYLHGSDSLSCEETSDISLDLDQESQLSRTHSLR